ncbi:MAG: hypothetical protein RLZZ74_352 [Cyanobacteriota bacterium]|jgi:hypothetical protein
MPGLKEKLEQDVADISWKELQAHAKRDAIIVIKDELELSVVAVAIAEDNTTSVQGWIGEQAIAKPTAQQLTDWNQNPEKQFVALIVQPFVVVKEAS